MLGVLEVRSERARSREADWLPALADMGSLLALFLKRQRAEADLQRFARYDSLTGLPNRSFFLDTLERTLSRAGRQRTRSALVFLDLDGFKAVNDGLGHAAGDTVLQTMAERLRGGHPQLRPRGPHRGRRVHRPRAEPRPAPTTPPSWPGASSTAWPAPARPTTTR